MLATFVIETKGTQEYRFTKSEFIERFSQAYGKSAADEINSALSI
jgi:adenosine kinase